MTFTPTPPTKPGIYVWRRDSKTSGTVTSVFSEDGKLGIMGPDGDTYPLYIGGEWSSRLVPVEEVEKAYNEGYSNGLLTDCPEGMGGNLGYGESRARKIVEGEI